MNAADNKRRLQHVFAETANGNGRPFIDCLSDDVRWTIIGSTAWSRTYEGKADVIGNLLKPLGAQLGNRNVIVPLRFIAEDDLVVVEAQGRNTTQAGTPYHNSYCWVCRMSGGRIVEMTEYADTQLIDCVLQSPG
ncbi:MULTISPECIES: nuclear transport factor 2 family protein [Pseudomonadaceae]|uniref:SnoaL-like domain-containing protein n=1 Tax=Pseudomonas indica TaxID=137658 RepID=A0A1G8VN23_9PSED|nr:MULTISPECIES: nuclear transport factor 2 family protein [Pseudomonas]MBU3057831.1 nuclear transport factor 2 family protein [Pseudomonas indica]PAU63564.1 hypothetical protein BZL42_04230 [Pseudomonas indica]SDJ67476.1 hypothetical protein SAMN05216186_102295 [Pseudomonas indica]